MLQTMKNMKRLRIYLIIMVILQKGLAVVIVLLGKRIECLLQYQKKTTE